MTASSSLIIFQRAKLWTPSIIQLCWCNWRTFWRKNGAGRSPRVSCSCTTTPRLTGYLQLRRNWPTWDSSALTTHPILRIWPRRNTTCSLDWKSNWMYTKSSLNQLPHAGFKQHLTIRSIPSITTSVAWYTRHKLNFRALDIKWDIAMWIFCGRKPSLELNSARYKNLIRYFEYLCTWRVKEITTAVFRCVYMWFSFFSFVLVAYRHTYIYALGQWHTEGMVLGVETSPTPEILKALKIMPNSTRLWKLLKIAEFWSQHPKMFGKRP